MLGNHIYVYILNIYIYIINGLGGCFRISNQGRLFILHCSPNHQRSLRWLGEGFSLSLVWMILQSSVMKTQQDCISYSDWQRLEALYQRRGVPRQICFFFLKFLFSDHFLPHWFFFFHKVRVVPCDFYDMMVTIIVVSIISHKWALHVMVDPPKPGRRFNIRRSDKPKSILRPLKHVP